MINFGLAREIYGHQPWMVDAVSFSSLFSILKDFRNGVSYEHDAENKLNSSYVLGVQSKTKTITAEWQLSEHDEDVVAITHINGPITKGGGASSFGTKQMSRRMSDMTKNDKVKGHIIIADSGGGATNAVVFMKDAIQEAQAAGKPVVTLIEKGGLCASAMFYISSFSDFIFSETPDNIVGSIGTMIEFQGFPKQHTEENGLVHVRAYATASINKNGAFEEALKGNLEPITSDVLDPVNEKFLADVRSNRENVQDEQLTGKTFDAGDVIGSLVDAIGNIDDAISKVLELSSSTTQNNHSAIVPKNKSNNLNNSKMDVNEFQQAHPATYNEVLQVGTLAERDRVGAWMAHANTDMEAVIAGIKSGEVISATQREEFLVKGASLNHLQNLKKDSQGSVTTAQTAAVTEELTADEKELQEYEKSLDNELKK